jgi:hypothetical protein
VFLERLDQTLQVLPELREWFEEDLRPLKPPSHLQRHAASYVAGALVVAGITTLIIQKRSNIYDWSKARATSLRAFYHNHLTVPIRSIYAYDLLTHHRSIIIIPFSFPHLLTLHCICSSYILHVICEMGVIVMCSIHLKIIERRQMKETR